MRAIGNCGPRHCSSALRLVVAGMAFSLAGVAAAQPSSEERLLAEADVRIAKCRKTDAAVTVVDAAGKPIAGARVAIDQTAPRVSLVPTSSSGAGRRTIRRRKRTAGISPNCSTMRRSGSTGPPTSASGASRPTPTRSRLPGGARNTASPSKGTRWHGTSPIPAGCQTIRTRLAGCNWCGSTIASRGLPA